MRRLESGVVVPNEAQQVSVPAPAGPRIEGEVAADGVRRATFLPPAFEVEPGPV